MLTPEVKRILLVEDDAVHAKLIMRQLENHCDVAVEHVRDGEAALGYMQHLSPFGANPRPDLVLLDLRLPGLSGLEVLKRLKLDPKLRSIPVVVLTTSDNHRDTTEAYCLGANSYVVKPLDFGALKHMLDDLTCYWCAWNQPA